MLIDFAAGYQSKRGWRETTLALGPHHSVMGVHELIIRRAGEARYIHNVSTGPVQYVRLISRFSIVLSHAFVAGKQVMGLLPWRSNVSGARPAMSFCRPLPDRLMYQFRTSDILLCAAALILD
jgi:hypothetical protein